MGKEELSPNAKLVHKAGVTKAWEIMETPLRLAARDLGYAVAVHGSLARDLDLVAIPWRDHNVSSPDRLVETLVGMLRGLFGRANRFNDWTVKPHGRQATTVMIWMGHGHSIDIDLSIMPVIEKPKSEDDK